MAMGPIRSAFARMLVAPNPRGVRHFAASAGETQPERVAAEMVRYALGGAAHRTSPEEAMRILEQGASNLQGGGEGSAEAVGTLMLAMSTLLYRSGRRQDAIEKLKATQQVAPSAPFRVAAWESLMGLRMEAGQEISSSVAPNDSVDMSIKDDDSDSPDQEHLKFRVNAIKGLIALLNGETDSAAQLFVDGCRNFAGGKNHTENAALSYGEYLHCVGDFPMATQVYERVLEAISMEDISRNLLAAGNMVPEEVSLGATCAYGQLLCHSGKFGEAEDYLTRALKKAEEHFGANHPKVGIVLTCVARMYKLKAKSEGSSSIMVQEGLYRKALEVLKAPAISSEGNSKQMDWRDIISLARATWDYGGGVRAQCTSGQLGGGGWGSRGEWWCSPRAPGPARPSDRRGQPHPGLAMAAVSRARRKAKAAVGQLDHASAYPRSRRVKLAESLALRAPTEEGAKLARSWPWRRWAQLAHAAARARGRRA